jgi:DNA end-binding protein Ku
VLDLMRFDDEITDPAELDLPQDADLDRREVEMAERLIENLTAPFDASKYTDDYRRELLQVIREKVAGREPEPVEEGRPSPQVIDIMSALKASLERTEREGGRAGGRRAGGAGKAARARGGRGAASKGAGRKAGPGRAGGGRAAGGRDGGRKRSAPDERRRKAG